MSQQVERRATESLLRLIAEGTAPVIGEEFFRSLVRHLAEALRVKYAFVAEFAGVKARVRTLAFWAGGHFMDNFEYDLEGTPCEAVLAGHMCLYPEGVQALFPRDEALVEMAAQSYIAVPLSDQSGDVLGHLALIDVKPMPMAPRELSVFTIFAARARTELERKRAEEARARSEERLSSVLSSAMDAIITIDGERHITLFNAAAERVFGCAATCAVGQPQDRFLSRRFRSLLEECIAGEIGGGAKALDQGDGAGVRFGAFEPRLQHPSTLARARWGLSHHRERAGVP